MEINKRLIELEDTAYDAVQKYSTRPNYMIKKTMVDLFKDGFNEGIKSDEAKEFWYRFFKQEKE